MMAEFPETQYATSDGLSIAYQVWGDGPYDLVFTPGIISHLEAQLESPEYVYLMRSLSAFTRVIKFDKRGNGMSDRIVGAPTVDERVTDIQAVMDAAGVEKAALAGYSEGGAMSLVFAARQPERVSKLIICGGGATGRVAGGEESEDEWHNAAEQLMSNWGKVGGIHRYSFLGPGLDDTDGQAQFARFCRMSATPATMVALSKMAAYIDVRDVLPSIQQPTLILRRERESASRERSMVMAEHIPNAAYIELPGDEHQPYLGDVDSYVRTIRDFVLDEPSAISVPAASKRVLTSVLFTDLVGSTENQLRVGDDMYRELMDRHDNLTQRQIHRHKGLFIRSTGDGLLARFDAPTSAIACAVAIRDSLSSIDLEMRAGIHTGEIEIRGDDISGISVNIASRIADQAGSGEILTSDLTRQLMIGSDVSFQRRGAFELKGVPGKWPLYTAFMD